MWTRRIYGWETRGTGNPTEKWVTHGFSPWFFRGWLSVIFYLDHPNVVDETTIGARTKHRKYGHILKGNPWKDDQIFFWSKKYMETKIRICMFCFDQHVLENVDQNNNQNSVFRMPFCTVRVLSSTSSSLTLRWNFRRWSQPLWLRPFFKNSPETANLGQNQFVSVIF